MGALPGDVGARTTAGRPPAPLTEFVGRTAELAELQELVAGSRLVSLVGPGGCGKTRLAIELAHRLEGSGTALCWVALETTSSPAEIPRALANALGVRENAERGLLDSVCAAMATRTLVLVLDNCEHLLPGCAEVVRELLERCIRVHVLVTSRTPLGLGGELRWPVPPLTVPDASQSHTAAELQTTESAQLFVERARVAAPGFAIGDQDAAAVARICRGLDGLALAIELAAARVRVLSVSEIAEALENRLAILTAVQPASDRHRSMRAALDWSYRLMPTAEQRLFAELSVFVGGFDLDAVRAVHVAERNEPALLDQVTSLVDRSLLVPTVSGGRTRYALPETVRLYAAEHLHDPVEVRARVVRWYRDFAERAEAELSGQDQVRWLDRIELERPNIAAAVQWSLDVDGTPSHALRIAASLWRFCYLRGYYTEGRAWSETTLAANADAPTSLRARALVAAGKLAYLQCAYDDAQQRLQDALAAHRDTGDERGIAAVLDSLGSIHRERGRYAAARTLHNESRQHSWRVNDADGVARSTNYLSLLAWLQHDLPTATAAAEEALVRYRATGDSEGIAWSLINLGAAALYGGHPAQAAGFVEESLRESRAAGYREGVAWSLNLLGLLALERGDTAQAQRLLRDSLAEHWALGDRWRTASVLEATAAVFVAVGDPGRAGRLLGAADGLRASIGAPRPTVEQDLAYRTRGRIDEAAGGASRTDNERLGRLAALDSVVAELLRGQVEPVAQVDDGSVDVLALGGCRVLRDGEVVPAAEFGYAKPRELLCFLIDRADATKEQIGAALWPWVSAAGLRSSFHSTVHHLRSALGSERILFSDGRYRFNRDLPYEYDVARFEALVGSSHDENVDDLAAAVALYRGDYLLDLDGGSWIDERRAQLRRGYERALAELSRLYSATGRHHDAIEVLHRALEHDPLDESAHRALMRCYADAGEPAAALRQYETLRQILRAELDTTPAAETVELQARIRSGQRA